MSDTPKVDAAVGGCGPLDPDKDFVKLAAIYSGLLGLARELERRVTQLEEECIRLSDQYEGSWDGSGDR